MAVQFLLVLLLQTEDDLHGTQAGRYFANVSDRDLRGVSAAIMLHL